MVVNVSVYLYLSAFVCVYVCVCVWVCVCCNTTCVVYVKTIDIYFKKTD